MKFLGKNGEKEENYRENFWFCHFPQGIF